MKEALLPRVLASVDKTIMPIHCVRYTQGRSKEHHSNREIYAASQFAYLYYALKVCTRFVMKKYILLSM